MGIKYTKKNEDNEDKSKTVQAEEFILRLTSTKRKDQDKKELPRTEVNP